MQSDVIVVGAGVIGLTSAIRLAEDGWRVRVLSDRDLLDTTSAVAAAIWLPYRAAPVDRVFAWAHVTHTVLLEHAADRESGVVDRPGRLFWHSAPDEALSRLPASVAPPVALTTFPPGFAGGASLRLPVVEMPLYLRWLVHQLAAFRITIEARHVDTLDELADEAPLVVDATGLRARELVGDDSLFPIRGQIVRIENPGLDGFTLDQDDPTGVRYVIPRSRDVIVGGTALENVWDVTPSRETRERVLALATEIEPRLAGARIIEDRVGLRPGRPTVRLEAESRADGCTVIHNYGHGGSGVTISWGCADEAAALARDVLGATAGR